MQTVYYLNLLKLKLYLVNTYIKVDKNLNGNFLQGMRDFKLNKGVSEWV